MAGKTPTQAKSTRDTLAKVRAHVSDVERRLKSADKNTKRSVKALETAFCALKDKVGAAGSDDLKSHIEELSTYLNRKLDDSRVQINQELERALAASDIDHVREALSKATARLSSAERRQAESIQKVNEQIIRLATAIDNRVRNETREREALQQRVEAQLEQARTQTEQRVSAIEDTSASAILKIGSQVSQLSAELTEARGAIEQRTEGRIYEAALDSQHEIENLKADINARLETVSGPQAYIDITPVERSVAALTARLDTLETRISAGTQSGAIPPAAGNAEPPFPLAKPAVIIDEPQMQAPPPATLPLPAANPIAAQKAPQDPGAPLEFDPAQYEHTAYDVPAAQDAPPQNPYAMPPLEAGQPQAGHANAQMALHDYDAPADYDPYGAAQAPDYADMIMQPVSGDMTQAASQAEMHADPDMNPYAGNPYMDNPYADNPFSAGLPGGQAVNPYAPPPQGAPHSADPPDLNSDMSMAAARPGADGPAAKKSRLPSLSLPKRKTNSKTAGASPALSPRTLRTAASAAALVAVVAAGAWMVKDRLPGAERKMAAVSEDNRAATQSQTAQTVQPMPVSITKPTGLMSAPDGAADINPSKPRIDNFATLDAAVAAGNPVAQLQKGLTLLQSGSETEAVPFIRAAANQNLPAAQYYLGNMYENGQGVKADAGQARMLTERAARAGHRIAMYDLALYYIEGKGGVSADLSIAAQWFEKAAQFGMTDAQYNLAVLYERGTGVTADPAEAYNWYAIAGSQGDQDAARRAAQLELELPADMLERAKSKVARFEPADFNPETNGIFKSLPWNTGRPQNTVATVQQLLLDLGYDAGTADGAMGPRTRDAIKAFERANGMPETGRVDDIIVQTLKDVAGA